MQGEREATRPLRLANRRHQGMAGYVTDSDVQYWRHAKPKHPLRYDPPRIGDYIKAAFFIVATLFTAWLWMNAIDLLIPSYWW